jgi:hypothetical protein
MKILPVVKQIWKVVGLIFLLCFVSFFIYDQEFKSIQPLPQAIACDYHASHKTQQSLVGSSYSTKLSFPEIRAYYNAELSRRGWLFQRERTLHDWGRDFGGKSVYYCKGSYTASLEYAGENAGSGWNYALEVSWGLGSLFDKWKGNLCE